MASMIQGFEERIAGLEETVRTLSGISEHVTTKELCVADDTGAQTCVSKAQLDALLKLAEREDVQVVYPVHPNPNVSGPVRRLLGNHPRILLTEPLDYISFVDLARRAANEGLSMDAIKKSVKQWRPDLDRA